MFFSELEAYLRKTYPKFLAINGLDQKQIFQNAGIAKDSSRQHLALGEYLNIYAKAIAALNAEDLSALVASWQNLAHLRNQPAHGDMGPDKWKEHLLILIADLPRVRTLVELIHTRTSIAPEFTY